MPNHARYWRKVLWPKDEPGSWTMRFLRSTKYAPNDAYVLMDYGLFLGQKFSKGTGRGNNKIWSINLQESLWFGKVFTAANKYLKPRFLWQSRLWNQTCSSRNTWKIVFFRTSKLACNLDPQHFGLIWQAANAAENNYSGIETTGWIYSKRTSSHSAALNSIQLRHNGQLSNRSWRRLERWLGMQQNGRSGLSQSVHNRKSGMWRKVLDQIEITFSIVFL